MVKMPNTDPNNVIESGNSLYDFGLRLQFIRLEACLTQAEFAKSLRLSPPGYHAYEKGRRKMQVDSILRIHQLYNVDLNWLITGRVVAPNDTILQEFIAFSAELDAYLLKNEVVVDKTRKQITLSKWLQARIKNYRPSWQEVLIWIEIAKG
jgi:transcriptional regulator with XRE-family HTH domain